MVGVLGPAVNIVASLEVTEGFKLLMGEEEELHGQQIYVDAWTGTLERLELEKGDDLCPACDLGRFEFLEARVGSYLTSLCGREVVQVKGHHRRGCGPITVHQVCWLIEAPARKAKKGM